MFCDGIRPGSDLTNLDTDFNYSEAKTSSSALKKLSSNTTQSTPVKHNKNLPLEDPVTKSFIPADETSLPPTVTLFKSGKVLRSTIYIVNYECNKIRCLK